MVEKQGAVGASFLLTVISVVASLAISATIHTMTVGWSAPWRPGEIWIPILAPLLVAPPASYFSFRVLEQLFESEAAKEKLLIELQNALDDVHKLSGLLPICASCKDIKTERGDWQSIESYVTQHSEADFSHGLCPKCARNLYPSQFHKIEKS